MKQFQRYLIILLITFSLVDCDSQPDESATSTHLPITLKQGYGPFYPSFGFLSAEHVGDALWGKIYQPLKGIPKTWSSVTKSMIWLDAHQLVYQNYKLGNITPANYQYLQREWKWKPDTSKLSAKPIECYVYAIKGFDEKSNKWAVVVDTNNNLDLSDETNIYPEVIKTGTVPDKVEQAQTIHYEVYQKGSISSARAPMVVRRMGDQFLYNFPQYATATFKSHNKEYEILISPSFLRLDFEGSTISLPSAIVKSGKVDPQKLIAVGENIEIEHVVYKNKGVDVFHNRLDLDPVDPTTGKEYSLQVGYPFRPQTVKDFRTGKAISLGGKKGKYVFIDFWGTWCQGCVEEIPSLKKVYRSIDKSKVDFVSIACHNSAQQLTVFLAKERLEWTQILADDSNKLVDLYGVNGYPTSVLLNDQGIVVAKNLGASELKNKLSELSK